METLRTTIVHKPRQITEKSAVSDLLHEALEERTMNVEQLLVSVGDLGRGRISRSVRRSRLNGGNKLYCTTSS